MARDSITEIAARLASLAPAAAIRAALVAVERADALLARHFAALAEPPRYIDSVVGMRHVVDTGLSTRALDWVRHAIVGQAIVGGAIPPSPEISEAYKEPICAMQDDDLEFPEAIELAYYAVYNFYRAAVGLDRRAETLALCVHQALAGCWCAGEDPESVSVAAWWHAATH